MRLTSNILCCGIGLLVLLGSSLDKLRCQGAEVSGQAAATTNLIIKASILVHSGEPDPTWVFTNVVEIAKLRNLITGLPASPPPSWPILGFRGFMLTAKDQNSGFPPCVRVFRGVVKIRSQDRDLYFRDERHLEAFLSEQAKARGLDKFIKDSAPGEP